MTSDPVSPRKRDNEAGRQLSPEQAAAAAMVAAAKARGLELTGAGVAQQVDAADRPGRAAGSDRGVEMGGRRRHRGRTPECSRRPAIPGISIVEKGDPGRPAALADLAAPGAAADLLGTFPPEAGPTQAPACRPPRTPVLRLRRSRDDLLRSFTTCSPGAVMTPHHIGGHRSMCSTEHRTRRPWRSGGPAGAVRRQRRSIA
jgi:hypothetical protein